MVTRLLMRARTILSITVATTTAIAVLKAFIEGDKALDDLKMELKQGEDESTKVDSDNINPSQEEPQGTVYAAAAAIQSALEYAAKLDDEAQDEVLEFISEVIVNLKVPFALQVTAILFVTIGQHAVLGTVLHKLFCKAANSEKTTDFAQKVREMGDNAWNSVPSGDEVNSAFEAFMTSSSERAKATGEGVNEAAQFATAALNSAIGGFFRMIRNAADDVADKFESDEDEVGQVD